MCEWPSGRQHNEQSGELTMWKRNILDATGSLRQNARSMKWWGFGGMFNVANVSHTSLLCCSSIRGDLACALLT